jgi:hypothetical protein
MLCKVQSCSEDYSVTFSLLVAPARIYLLQRPRKIVIEDDCGVSPSRHVNFNALSIDSIDHGASFAIALEPDRNPVIRLNFLTAASRELHGTKVDGSPGAIDGSVDNGGCSVGFVVEANTALGSTVVHTALPVWGQGVGLAGSDGLDISRRHDLD